MNKNSVKLGDYFQQGDVIFKCSKKPVKAKRLKGNVVVEGSHGGNNHVLGGSDFTLLDVEGKPFLEIKKDTDALHPEHKTITLPKGYYELVRVKEYDHILEESREVID